MSSKPKNLATVAVVVAVLGMGIWLVISKKPAVNSPGEGTLVTSETNTEVGTSRTNTGSGVFSSRLRAGTNVPLSGDPVESADTAIITNWEERVDVVLRKEGDAGPKAKELLSVFPRFPEAGQVETAQHIANLLPDGEYASLATYFTNTATPVDVQDVIMADLLGRPNSVKLPVLLEAARNPQHAKATEAKDLLELYLEKDYGTDWDRWQKEVVAWLKANPDQN